RLDPRLDLRNHSPTGFEWGYGGSGPAQLALALAASRLPDRLARITYQRLKGKLVAALNDNWHLSADRLDALLAELIAADVAADLERLPGFPSSCNPEALPS
ncbi:MAG TPA: DUF6166 domain-containing protein, partial [Thermoanaerobaculia bacterium]|nr:DUF6166 domain-containing protein [Thermoanaerobaculia bacterium]